MYHGNLSKKNIIMAQGWVHLVGWFIILVSVVSAKPVIFVNPSSSCNTNCDGSLQHPMATLQAAFDAIGPTGLVHIVLAPGTYQGPGNSGVVSPQGKIYIWYISIFHLLIKEWPQLLNRVYSTLRGTSSQDTIIDCNGSDFAFYLSNGNYYIKGITVQNCTNSTIGALEMFSGTLYLTDTRWISNSALNGGALISNHAGVIFQGTNEFINNQATNQGGAIYAIDSAIITTGNEQFSGNSAGGQTTTATANVELNQAYLTYPPTNPKIPPYTQGQVEPYPSTYVDASSTCGLSCDGSAGRPYNNLIDGILHGNSSNGGNIYVMPGLYTGPYNTNISVYYSRVFIQQWPNTTGEIILDCNGVSNGFYFFNGEMSLSDFTIRNCTAGPESVGGGALRILDCVLTLTNVNLIDNYAYNDGGAIWFEYTYLSIYGGSIRGNMAGNTGGGVWAGGLLQLYQNLVFSGNVAGPGRRPSDTECATFTNIFYDEPAVLTDGSIVFDVGGLGSCAVSASSLDTFALFPGDLHAELHPIYAYNGEVSADFGSLLFDSLVELDSNGNPVPNGTATSADLNWGLSVSNTTDSLVVQYDAFTPDVRFLRIIYEFFRTNGSITAQTGNHTDNIGAGTVKTTIEVALWPFQSKQNSLALTLKFDTNTAVTNALTQQLQSGGVSSSQLSTIETQTLTAFFQANGQALYDDREVVGNVSYSLVQQQTVVYFKLVFSAFNFFVSYDPQFSVLLGGTTQQQQGDGSSSTNAGLIAGLTVGLIGGALIVIVVIVLFGVVGVGVVTLIKNKRRSARPKGIGVGAADLHLRDAL